MMASGSSLRPQVLSMYRRLLRLSRSWVAKAEDQTVVEREYIRDETRRLFRANQHIETAAGGGGREEGDEVRERLREAEARITMAEHYRNPYPRPVNLPPRSYAKKEGKVTGKAIRKLNERSKPIYVKSIDDTKNQS